jgi:NAD(P)-dependent dehydrogenase (short-subunit alcohol dehydrogenase family)
MNKKVTLITGANSGMGLATAIALAKEDHQIILACRDEDRGKQALKKVISESGSSEVDLMLLDLSSFHSISLFAKQFEEKYNTLDILINNAGIITTKREITEDGFEAMLGVNHLGHFLLTNLLLEHLKRSDKGKVITISSGAYKYGKIDFEDMNLEKKFSPFRAYGRSKLANILFTKELSRRLQDTNIAANCLHPGAVSTNMGVNRDTGFGKSIHFLLRPFFQTPLEGSQTAIYLALSPEVEEISGKYFYKKKVKDIEGQAMDDNLAQILWEWSEQQVGLQPVKLK